jgi:hypothetical protein
VQKLSNRDIEESSNNGRKETDSGNSELFWDNPAMGI